MRRLLALLILPGLLSLSGLNLWLIEAADTAHRLFSEINEHGASQGLDRVWEGSHFCDRDQGFENAKKMEKKTASLLLKEKMNPTDQTENPPSLSDLTLVHFVSLLHSPGSIYLKTDPPTPPPNFIS